MTFKSTWETTTQYKPVPASDILHLLAHAFPQTQIASYKILSGGCANVNVKVTLANQSHFILRIYLRDKDAAFREQALAKLLKPGIAIPSVHKIADHQGYRYAIVECMNGITLRDLLLGQEPCDVKAIMYQVGTCLAKLQGYRFPSSGFFDNELVPKGPFTKQGHVNYALQCLKDPQVLSQLSEELVQSITWCLHTYAAFFPDASETHLVHGDFDPANILVDQVNGQWAVSAILDWEFAFSGSMLCDVANMLRYAHQVTPDFAEAFLLALQDHGVLLPDSWQTSVHMLNLLSLLDCLVQSDPANRPNQAKDIQALLVYITKQLSG